MSSRFKFRVAEALDAVEICNTVAEAFDNYRSFAPIGWQPPGPDVEGTRSLLADPHTWCLLVDQGKTESAGHVSFIPASAAGLPINDPSLAHLWQLFVRPPHWGSGLAAQLLLLAEAEAVNRGYAAMRLITPAGQTRARRFYEREGYAPAGEVFTRQNWMDGLPCIEYRRELTTGP